MYVDTGVRYIQCKWEPPPILTLITAIIFVYKKLVGFGIGNQNIFAANVLSIRVYLCWLYP